MKASVIVQSGWGPEELKTNDRVISGYHTNVVRTYAEHVCDSATEENPEVRVLMNAIERTGSRFS